MRLLLSIFILAGLALAQTAVVRQAGATEGAFLGSVSSDPSSPSNGSCWYNSTSTTFKCRENGTTKTMIGAAGSSAACDPFSRQGVCEVEEFSGYYNSGTAYPGNLMWTITTQVVPEPLVNNTYGVARLQTAYAANNPAGIWRGHSGSGNYVFGSAAAYTDTEIQFRFKVDATANRKFYCGLARAQQTSTPTDGVWIKFDSAGASTFVAETCSGSTCSTSATNMPTPSGGTWYTLKIRWGASAGTIYFSVASGTGAFSTETSIATNLPTNGQYLGCYLNNSTDGAGYMDLDKFMLIRTDSGR